ncbi:hypothetical protein C7M84_017198 [Penaeus vannamei]|uniref:Uncharacterized protein n=1 Tax=Penaeus vannamei TaxID=6689 RepID=A0A423SKS8_PENVA|nr:hypothetical protein C7M84_017198 [Penaeus vannamei]
MHQEITMYDELMRRLDHVTLKLREYKTKNQELEARLRAAEDRDRPAASPPPPAPLPIFNVVVDKESIPPFRGDTPAAQPLRRNQEVEAWIRHIENVAKPATDATFISAARASCKGPADLIVNSPMFDGIREFLHDPERVQDDHHTGTTRFLSTARGIVYQGVRDYPDVGNPEPLLKRLFLQGLPLWLREYLAIIDELPLDRLVETAQRIWNTRTGVARTEPLADRHPPRPLRAVAPVESRPNIAELAGAHTIEPRAMTTQSAAIARVEGHLVKDCPFPPPSDGSAPVAGGTRWGQPLQYPRSSDTGAIGRNSLNPHLQPTSRTTDGDILIGIDLLKRLDFRLGYDSRTNNSYLRLRGKAFTVRYVNKDSLELTAVVMKMKGMSVPVPPARAAIRRSVSCPPESGRFVPVRVPDALIGKQLLVEGLGYSVILPREVIKPSSKEAVVWVVNPTLNPVKLRNGTHWSNFMRLRKCVTPEAPGNVASIADTPVAAVPTSALEKISLQHLSDHRDKFAIGEVPDIVHEIPTQEKHPLCQRHREDAHCKLREALDVARKAAQEASRKARQEYAAYHNRNLRPPWSLEAGAPGQGPAKVVKKLGPVNYVVQDLSPPFSERNCHANQLRPFKLEEELTFPDASPYHDPDYVDPWLPDDAEPDHSNTSTSCGLSSETDVARTTNSARPYLELPECPGPPLL